MNHTREPWYAIQNPIWGNADYRISNKENDEWANFNQIAYAHKANAKRIIACVNACAGITNEALEAGIIEDALYCLINHNRGVTQDEKGPYFYNGVRIWEEAK